MSRLFPALASKPEVRQWNDTDDGPWFTPGMSSAYVDAERAFSLSAVWACETLISDAISTLPVDMYRKQDDQRFETTPPAWVESPNPWFNRIDFDTQRVLSLLGWGNAYTLLVKVGSALERWNLDPSHMGVRRSGVNLTYFYCGQQVPTANVQHIRGYILPGHHCGMSAIAHAQLTLNGSSNAESASSALFQNGIAPSGVLQVPDMPAETSKKVVARLREQFARAHGGPTNTGKPMVLPGGTTWKQTMLNPADAQLLESRKFSINEICRWFRVPPHEIQDIVDNASQGGGQGIEQMSINFAQKTLLPWVSRLEASDNTLLPRGQYEKYNLNAYVRTDLKTRYEAHNIARMGGWASANDVRKLEDEPRIDNGDIYLEPLNFHEAGKEPPASKSAPVAPIKDTGATDGSV